MKEQDFIIETTKSVRKIIDAIADKEYARLASFARIDSSWVKPGHTQEAAILDFGKWLDEQLDIWAEDEGRDFEIDHFRADCLDEIELEGKRSFTTYNLTSAGEQLDLWVEFRLKIEDDGQIRTIFNVNI